MHQRLKKRKQNGDFFTIQSFTKKNSNVAAIKNTKHNGKTYKTSTKTATTYG